MTAAGRRAARRACATCRRYKTRCELPDADIDGGLNPLPPDKACHRCSVLSQVCILENTPRPSRPSSSSGRGPVRIRRPSTKVSPPILATTSSSLSSSTGHSVENVNVITSEGSPELSGVDLLVLDKWMLSGQQSQWSRIPTGDPTQESSSSILPTSSPAYDQPIEFAYALLSNAYGPKFGNVFQNGGNLKEVMAHVAVFQASVDLPSRYDQLLVYHPHLPPVEDLTTDTVGSTLLTATVLYLCYRMDSLATAAIYLRDLLLLRLRTSHHGGMALELLTLHAPFGLLPGQAVDQSHVDVLRSIPVILKHASKTRLEHARAIMAGPLIDAFNSSDVWTWISLCEIEASRCNPTYHATRPPDTLQPTAKLCDTFLSQLDLWLGDRSRLLGKLFLCERVLLLHIEVDCYLKTRDMVKQVISGSTMDVLESVTSVVRSAIQACDDVEHRIQVVLGSSPAPTSWTSIRKMMRYASEGAIHRAGFRFAYALSSLNEVRCSPILDLDRAADEAFMLARQPSQIALFFSQIDKTSRQLQEYCRQAINDRANSCEQILVVFVGTPTFASDEIVPWHFCSALALGSTKILFQIEFGPSSVSGAALTNRRISLRPEQWDYLVSQAAVRLKGLEGRGSLSAACGNLVDSLARLTAKRRGIVLDISTLVTPDPSVASNPVPTFSAAAGHWPPDVQWTLPPPIAADATASTADVVDNGLEPSLAPEDLPGGHGVNWWDLFQVRVENGQPVHGSIPQYF